MDACSPKIDAVQLKVKEGRGGEKNGPNPQFQKPSTYVRGSIKALCEMEKKEK